MLRWPPPDRGETPSRPGEENGPVTAGDGPRGIPPDDRPAAPGAPGEGEVLLDGKPVTLATPAAAQHAGIAVIYQEPTLFPDLSVAENIFMGRQPLVAGRRIDRCKMLADAAGLFGRLGVRLDPGR